jgi:hypothetical protein
MHAYIHSLTMTAFDIKLCDATHFAVHRDRCSQLAEIDSLIVVNASDLKKNSAQAIH